MTELINLHQLREQTRYYLDRDRVAEIDPDHLLALIDTAEAARELNLDCDCDECLSKLDRLRESLTRFTTSQPPK